MNAKTTCYHCEYFPAIAIATLTNGNVMRVCEGCSLSLGKFVTNLLVIRKGE
jgi:hypothetical protein